MKIRRTIALLTAFAMIAALVPAMALTAFAEDETPDEVRGIVTADGMRAYKIIGENLISGGSFEGDDWGDQLTVGANHGNDGKAYTGNMAESGVWRRARLSADAYDGQYALRLDSTTSSNGNVINDANKPASIKHYIHNDSSSSKSYFVRFYAMGPSSLAFSLCDVDETDESVTGTDALLSNSSWTPVEGYITIPKGRYLLINVYNMSAGTYIDDFSVYEVTTDADSRAFDSAMTQWNTKFVKPNSDIINGTARVTKNLNLIKSAGKATVTWVSSRPDIISVDGAYTAPAENTVVTLTATITYGIYSTVRTYRVTAQGIADDVRAKIAAAVPYVIQSNIKLPSSLTGYDGSRVTWKSSNPAVLSNNGVYKAPAEQSTITLTATFVWGNATLETTVEAVVGVHFSMITNGTFDVVRDIGGGVKEIYDWTVGVPGVNSRNGVAAMTTENFEIQRETLLDENGRPYVNNFLVTKGHNYLDQPESIRRYIKLEPGKYYRLSYKVRYMGTGSSEEAYIGAYLVSSSGEELLVEPTSNFQSRYGDEFGGIYYKDGSEWQDASNHRLTAEDGWQTYETILRPSSRRPYLLIAAKWLNRNTSNTQGSANSDGRWGFDDFVLEEFDVKFRKDVTINYIDYETGRSIKKARVEKDQPGGMEYAAPASDKDDITYNNATYRYDPTSVDKILVTEDENVINLYFRRLSPVEVTVNFLTVDAAGNVNGTVKAAETFEGYSGLENKAPLAMVGGQPGILYEGGRTYRYVSGNDSFIASTNPSENIINLYFSEVDNLIPNGGFTDNVNGWNSRIENGAIDSSVVSVGYDDELGANVLTLANTKGREDASSVGTAWTVEKGKSYHISFWVSGNKPTEKNYEYNQITDARKHDPSAIGWDCDGNLILGYGSKMNNGQWTRMDAVFEAKTNMVYFQTSWTDSIKFASFVLEEHTSDFTTSVTVNYLDRATGRPLKASRVESNLPGFNDGSATYSATTADKNAITVDGQTYRYDTNSSDTVILKNGSNVINLYFVIYAAVSAQDIVVELAAGEEPKLPTSVPVLYNDGTTANSNVTWDEIPAINEGDTVVVNGVTAAGPALTATIKMFYEGVPFIPDDYDEYDWVGGGTRKYAVPKGAENIIVNGDFHDGLNGWTNRRAEGDDQTIGKSTFTTDPAVNGRVLNIATGGRNDANAIGTVWNVQTGKTYYLSFWVGGPKPESKNYQYNLVTDARKHLDSKTTSWDADGNTIIAYGEKMTNNTWNHMEVVFTAKTDMIYFQSGWSAGTQTFADFQLYELVGDKYYDEGSTMSSRIRINYNGKDVGFRDVPKGEATPDLSREYLDCVIDYSHVDTSEPNGGTIYVTDPSKLSSISVGGLNVQVSAVNENINGVLIIAQYDKSGALIDVQIFDISVAAEENLKVPYTPVEGSKLVRAMVVESLDSLVPILRSSAR